MSLRRLPPVDRFLIVIGAILLVASNLYFYASNFDLGIGIFNPFVIMDIVGVYLALLEAYRLTHYALVDRDRPTTWTGPSLVIVTASILVALIVAIASLVPFDSGGAFEFFAWNFYVPFCAAALLIIPITALTRVLGTSGGRAAAFLLAIPAIMLIMAWYASPYSPKNFEFMFLLMTSPVLVWAAGTELAWDRWREMRTAQRAAAVGLAAVISIGLPLVLLWITFTMNVGF